MADAPHNQPAYNLGLGATIQVRMTVKEAMATAMAAKAGVCWMDSEHRDAIGKGAEKLNTAVEDHISRLKKLAGGIK